MAVRSHDGGHPAAPVARECPAGGPASSGARRGANGPEANLAASDVLNEVLGGCLEAVRVEAAAVRERLARRGLDCPLAGMGGTLEEWAGVGSLYAWELPEGRRDIRLDDAVRVRCHGGDALGFVAGWDPRGGRLRLATAEWLGRRPGPAELVFDPTWLLDALVGRLEEIRRDPGAFHPATALRLLGRGFPTLGEAEPRRPGSAELNGPQRQALRRILGSDVHFVWGPPGTGKTRLLGHAAAELAETGRVLVVAATNAAVDEAAVRVAAALGPVAVAANRVVRVGAEFSPTGDPALSLAAALDRFASGPGSWLAEDVRRLEDDLAVVPGRRGEAGPRVGRGGEPGPRMGRRGSVPGDGRVPGAPTLRARLGRLLAAARASEDPALAGRLGRLAGEMTRAAALVLGEADVVLTTFARLAVRDELASLRFESVVVDEASAAPLPAVLVAGARASGRAVAIGDFQQLPPVVVSRDPTAARWLSTDAFREAGILDEAAPGETPLPSPRDRLCAMLDEQYRMAPPIRSLVSDLFYGGRLRDAPEVAARPAAGEALVLVDTTGLGPRVEKEEGSRCNPAHLETVLQLIELLSRGGETDVAVVTPYRLQTRRLASLSRARLGPLAPRGLEIATIHRFQGREKRIVVLDTVDAPPGRSWFLDERRNPDFPRLLNVALSRSRSALVVVGTVEGLRRTLPREALLNRVLDRLRRDGRVVDARRAADAGRALFGGRRAGEG